MTQTAFSQTRPREAQPYRLPDLPYAPDALQPHLDARLLELHHGKHHAAYVTKANALLERLADERSTGLGDPVLLQGLERSLAFNSAGHVLHSLFWPSMAPDGGGEPEGEFRAAIDDTFGSFAAMRDQLSRTVSGIEGSGWAALSWEPTARRLIVQQIHDHHATFTPASVPILVIDGWEHAYYLQYLNERDRWVDAFWQVAAWPKVAERFETAMRAGDGAAV